MQRCSLVSSNPPSQTLSNTSKSISFLPTTYLPISRYPNIIPSFPISCLPSGGSGSTAFVKNKRNRYRKAYPGEVKGIVEEMRFVAMKLRNNGISGDNVSTDNNSGDGSNRKNGEWWPTVDGFMKYLVDSKLVFETLENIVDESTDVAYTYFRKSGLERSASISADLEWFQQEGIEIPEPSNPGITYATYLSELAERSAPSFLCHLYNIYFAHTSGGQAIGKQVSEKLFQGKELEFYKWEGDVPTLLSDVREKLNKLGEHWSRDVKNQCLREAAKAFRYSGQIVRLIIT